MKDNAHLMQQDFLRFFNLEDKDIRSLAIHHENDEVHLSVELNPSTQHCPSCMTPTSLAPVFPLPAQALYLRPHSSVIR